MSTVHGPALESMITHPRHHLDVSASHTQLFGLECVYTNALVSDARDHHTPELLTARTGGVAPR